MLGINLELNTWINNIISLLFFIGYGSSFAQTISGKLVSEEGPIEYVEIRNITQNKTSLSGSDGLFRIEADLRDTLSFEAVFYETQEIVVDSLVLKDELQVQMEKKEFELEELVITANKFTFDVEEYSGNFKEQLQNDFKDRSYLYTPVKEGGNLLELVSLAVEGVGKLLGGQKKEGVTYIALEDLEELFRKDGLFNDDLLKETLKIPVDNKFLFFAYCEDQALESRLLEPENKLLLLDKLIVLAGDFRKRLEETEDNQ